jgi:hypothetical protein
MVGTTGGQAIAYAYYPAFQYWNLSDKQDPNGLPRYWNSATRQAASAPATIAGTAKVVLVDQPGVEAMRLDSSLGTAVVLLNWNDAPIATLNVTLPNAGGLTHVSSVETANVVTTSVSGSNVTATLPIQNVDILMFEPAGASLPPSCH